MTLWYRDRGTLALIGKRYVPFLAALNLAWELAQLPLYAIWREASPRTLAFAVVHCTAGDVLIGTAALVLALFVERAGELGRWRWRRVALWSTLIALAYTVFSEWMNTALGRWAYSELMPTLTIGGAGIGLSPLAQWLIVPPLALYAAVRRSLTLI